MKKYITFLLMIVLCIACEGQIKPSSAEEGRGVVTQNDSIPRVPASITRMIQQGKNGEMWIAAFDGAFQYDGDDFTNITHSVSSSRFFSVLEDRAGTLWFGTIGDGVYRYDGIAFQHFTTEDGLLSNEVVCIYQDRAGDFWLGMNGGVTHYDGKAFRNYVLNKDTVAQGRIGYVVPNLQRPPNEVNAIIEDQAGRMWFGTRGKTFIYDEKTFEVVTHDGRPFQNIRWIIEDRTGNIWLGGSDGLWRYDGKIFTNITRNFTGYIYEDSHGNIWTSSQSILTNNWVLSRYDEKSLHDQHPTATQITTKYQDNQGMIFGISETPDGSIWIGGLDGVYQYDGMVISKIEEKK